MSGIKYEKQILAAIEHLRSKKARPDLSRICKLMLKSYKIPPKDTRADLNRCLKENKIFKVDYKDNISYRNAATWRKKLNYNDMASTTVATNERRIINSAIATLIYQDQSCLENGIAFDDLVKAAYSQDSKHSKKQLESIINKELASESLIKLPNGNLALGPADNEGDSSDSMKFEYNADSNTKMTSSANSSCRSSPLQQKMRGRPKKRPGDPPKQNIITSRNAGVRVGERRKISKKVFDPSDNNMPNKKKRGRPMGSLNKSTIRKRLMTGQKKEGTPLSESQHSFDGSGDEIEEQSQNETTGGVCSICLIQKSRGSNHRMVECRDCNNKAHSNCLNSASGIFRARPDNTWQCQHCKTCVVCCETNDAGVLTVCSLCSDSYHSQCHIPKISEKMQSWDQWECSNCMETRPSMASTGGYPSGILPSRHNRKIDPFLKPHEIDRSHSKITEEVPIDPNIPDITLWTVDEVYTYFKEHFPEAATLLREQEFDGTTLCIAQRADIVSGLGLPLGPALALYRIVVKLQTRKDDWTMCWG